jgi:hypothetical protein
MCTWHEERETRMRRIWGGVGRRWSDGKGGRGGGAMRRSVEGGAETEGGSVDLYIAKRERHADLIFLGRVGRTGWFGPNANKKTQDLGRGVGRKLWAGRKAHKRQSHDLRRVMWLKAGGVCGNPPRQWSARAPWKSSIRSILGKLVRSAVDFDRILTASGFWATNFGTLPA